MDQNEDINTLSTSVKQVRNDNPRRCAIFRLNQVSTGLIIAYLNILWDVYQDIGWLEWIVHIIIS